MENGAIVVGRLDNCIIRMMNMYDANRHRFYCVLVTVNLIWVVLLLGGSVPALYFLPYSEQVKFIAFMSYFVVVIIAFAVIQVISYQYIERMALTRERLRVNPGHGNIVTRNRSLLYRQPPPPVPTPKN
ncbi:hypothetical protein CAEBREN_13549 [Caenorhabditis brenneri]|uniref:Uncharacterized protein n=1 Tax=Caenorhabditis brenneri TaxID=135651 RepID=G0N1A8_CAEBE|nr:hypothetical protein CAEBREN_13549 [Caenorhabditis brenneri]